MTWKFLTCLLAGQVLVDHICPSHHAAYPCMLPRREICPQDTDIYSITTLFTLPYVISDYLGIHLVRILPQMSWSGLSIVRIVLHGRMMGSSPSQKFPRAQDPNTSFWKYMWNRCGKYMIVLFLRLVISFMAIFGLRYPAIFIYTLKITF